MGGNLAFLYRTFIQYVPNIDNSSAIKGKNSDINIGTTFVQFSCFIAYVCSCKLGRRQTGCCIHSATVIYYLSYAKLKPDRLKLPGEHLNAVLVNTDKMEAPNRPRHVRGKRRLKQMINSSESENEEDIPYPDFSIFDKFNDKTIAANVHKLEKTEITDTASIKILKKRKKSSLNETKTSISNDTSENHKLQSIY